MDWGGSTLILGGGVNWHSLWSEVLPVIKQGGHWFYCIIMDIWAKLTLKVKLGFDLEHGSWGGSQLILWGVNQHSLWKWSWDYLADPGWIDTDPGGGGWSTLTLKVKLGLPCRSGVDQHWSWGGQSTLTLKVKLGLPCGSGVDRHWSWGGSITLTLQVKFRLPLPMHCGYIIMHYG